jgi:hypothetical protein
LHILEDDHQRTLPRKCLEQKPQRREEFRGPRRRRTEGDRVCDHWDGVRAVMRFGEQVVQTTPAMDAGRFHDRLSNGVEAHRIPRRRAVQRDRACLVPKRSDHLSSQAGFPDPRVADDGYWHNETSAPCTTKRGSQSCEF